MREGLAADSLVRARDSLARTLLRKVVAAYLVVMVLVIVGQLAVAVVSTTEDVTRDLEATGRAFEPGLAQALWDMNEGQIEPILEGMIESRRVVGVRLLNERGQEVGAAGQVLDPDGSIVVIGEDGRRSQATGTWMIESSLPIVQQQHDREVQVGEVWLYSSLGVVLHELRWAVLFIVANSLLTVAALWFLFQRAFRSMLARPLAGLTAATRRISLENLEEVEVTGEGGARNELKILEESFNAMVGDLRDARRRLYEYAGELQASRQQLHDVFDHAPAGIFMKDAEGRYLLVNDRFETLFGLAGREVIGRTDDEILSPAVAATLAAGDEQATDGRPREREEAVRLDGVDRVLSIVRFGLDSASGEIYALCGFVTDATERRRAEELLASYNETLLQEVEQRTEALRIAKDEAEAANRAKSSFLANMSHELRTPLNAIIGYSQLIAEVSADDGHEAVVPDLHKIEGAGQHLLSLINNILDLAKVESGEVTVDLQAVEASEVVADVLQLVSVVADRNSNRLRVEIAPDVGQLMIDPTKLQQCLLNLLGNACKFTEKGIISLAVWRDRDGVDEAVVFQITDTGIGMSPEQLETVFEPFRQADMGTERRFGGTGLGLTITEQFCRLMNGSVEVESQEGVGTTFTMRFRVDQPVAVGRDACVDRPPPRVS